jgi:CBS domain-containing membrane protein
MAEKLNLALDIRETSSSKMGGASPATVARIYLSVACSYMKDGGAPTITEDCTTFSDLEREVFRIRSECDAILAQARSRFADGKSSDEARAEPVAQEESPPQPSDLREGAADVGKPIMKIAEHLQVADVMTCGPKTMRRNDKLSIADDLMKVGKFRHVVVLDDDSDDVVGIVSHRDIFHGALAWSMGQGKTAHQKSLNTIPTKDVMNTKVITIAPETPLADASQVMREKKIGCLPVIENRLLVGILTEGDLLAILSNAEYGAA